MDVPTKINRSSTDFISLAWCHNFNVSSVHTKIYLICLKSIYKMTQKKTKKNHSLFLCHARMEKKGKKSDGKICRRVFGIYS